MTGVNRHGNLGRGIWTRGELNRVFTTALLAVQRWCGSVLPRTRHSLLLVPLLAIVLASCTSGQESLSAGATDSPSSGTAPTCGAEVTPIPEPDRQINLVLDESGSMFVDESGEQVTWWSTAKYSLEVFAALLGPSDTLNVYRMSDYGPSASSDPTLVISGSDSISNRVTSVHQLELNGGSTPWKSVTAAAENLASSTATEKWLVVLTDGVFDDPAGDGKKIPTAEVESFLDELSDRIGARVAFMSIGTSAVVIAESDSRQSVTVTNGAEVLETMTTFANSTFGRSVVPAATTTGEWAPDIPLREVTLFAQGPNVVIGSAETSAAGAIEPVETAAVSWVENPIRVGGGEVYNPPPDETLEGVIARYVDVPSGTINFNVGNASQVDIFYKPDVRFGYSILDAQGQDIGNILQADAPYTLNFSFIDTSCTPVTSELLDPVEYSASVFLNDEEMSSNLIPGSTVQLPAKASPSDAYKISMSASYRGGVSSAEFPLFVSGEASIAYPVTSLAEFTSPDEGIPYQLIVKPNSQDASPTSLSREFTAQEWSALDPKAVTFQSDSNLEFEFLKGQMPGQATVLVRAPGGDVFAADTGTLAFTATIPAQEGIEETTIAPTTFEVLDDISGFDRLIHWFWNVGIWILVAIILFILLLGYLLKKRFPRRLKKRPTIEGIPRVIGQQRLNARGQFEVNGLRRLLPFVADTGTLKYVPAGTMGFRPMQVKAGPRKMLRLTNWKDIAKQSNVQVNGSPLDETTMKEPMFGASAMITADTPQMSFEMTPSQ
jgi:hypothetical protein